MSETCCHKRYRNYHDVSCGKPAKVERDGMHYCTIHDPVRIKSRDEKRNARWDREGNARTLRYEAQKLTSELVADALESADEHVRMKAEAITRKLAEAIALESVKP